MVNTTRLQGIARRFADTAVLYAAIDLELFTKIDKGAKTEELLSTATGLTLRNVDRLVTCLLSLGLVEWEDQAAGVLRNAPDVARYLVKGKRGYAAEWMTFMRHKVPDWMDMAVLLKQNAPPRKLGMYVEEAFTVEDAAKYHMATASIGFGAGAKFAREVDLSKRTHLLDLGGGSGGYSIAAVKRNPGLRATVLDLPQVIEGATKKYLAESGVADRVGVLPGDFTETTFPSVDVCVMASNLPQYNQELISLVVQRAYDALQPGGEFHLVGEVLRDDRVGPIDAAMWGMEEVINCSDGRSHTVADVVAYFEKAGFTSITVNDFIPSTLSRVTGIKKGSLARL